MGAPSAPNVVFIPWTNPHQHHKLRMAVINVYFCLYEVSDAVLSWCRLGWGMG
jgi:hypothetical protein